jgi:hypothetical protein
LLAKKGIGPLVDLSSSHKNNKQLPTAKQVTMIFNRYLVVFFAGLQSLSQAASLRKGAGGRRLTVEAEFNGLVQLLNTTYDGSCKIHTTGEYDPLATPIPTSTVATLAGMPECLRLAVSERPV